MSDNKISEITGLDRTTIVRSRQKYGIKTKETTGKVGEKIVYDTSLELGMEVVDMNDKDMTHEFDFLINRKRVEVKTATIYEDGYYRFVLTNSKERGSVEGEKCIRLPNGRTKRRYDLTCDYFVLVGLNESKTDFFIIPSKNLPINMQTIGVSPKPGGKYLPYKDRWDFLIGK